MEIKVKATGKEIYRFSLYHFLHSPAMILYLVFLAAFLGLKHWKTEYDPAILNLVFLIFIGYALFHVLSMRNKAERQANDPVNGAEITYKLEYNGIRVRQGRELTALNWEDIREVRKIGEMYVLYLAPRRGLLIPCRLLLRGREERFLGLLKQHMTDKQLAKLHLKKSGDTK